jgi:hypothetical protein
MGSSFGFNPTIIAELEMLISKLAHRAPNFTPREYQLMELLRQHRDVVLPQLEAITRSHMGTNTAGREKLDNLVRGIERICRAK